MVEGGYISLNTDIFQVLSKCSILLKLINLDKTYDLWQDILDQSLVLPVVSARLSLEQIKFFHVATSLPDS